MTNQHPITPPPELVEAWIREANHNEPMFAQVAVMGAQWGANQQLAEDAKWLDQHALDAPHLKITPVGESLIEAMRPQPPSLRKQAYDALDTYIYGEPAPKDKERTYNTIRRALEALDD